MRAKKIVAATLALGLFSLAGCGSSSSTDSAGGSSGAGASDASGAATTDPIKVTLIGSTSGALAAFGEAIGSTFQAAVDQVNADGGILGRQVVVTTVDDGSDATKGVNAAQEIANSDDQPDVVIPGNFSLTTIPMLPILSRAGIPTVATATSTAGNDPAAFPLNFGVSNTPAETIKGLVSHLKEEGIKTVAVAIADNETGHSTLTTIEQETAAAGITITGTEAMAPTTVDATAALSSLQAGNPEALLVPGISGPLAGTIFKDRAKIGWTIPTFTDVTTTANNLVTLAGGVENLKGVIYQELPYAVKGNPAQDSPAFQEFLTAITAANPNPTLPLGTLAAGWSAMAFLQGAIEKAGSTDPQQIAAAAESLQLADTPLWFQTTAPSLGLSSTNHYVAYDTYVYAPAGPRDTMGSLLPPTQ